MASKQVLLSPLPTPLRPCQVKSVLLMHYKGDQRVVYEACKSVVDAMPTEDKVI